MAASKPTFIITVRVLLHRGFLAQHFCLLFSYALLLLKTTALSVELWEHSIIVAVGWIRTTDFKVMSLARYHCVTPRSHFIIIINQYSTDYLVIIIKSLNHIALHYTINAIKFAIINCKLSW